MKAVVAAFNQEKALVGAFSVIVQPVVEPMDRFAALVVTNVGAQDHSPCISSSATAKTTCHVEMVPEHQIDGDTPLS